MFENIYISLSIYVTLQPPVGNDIWSFCKQSKAGLNSVFLLPDLTNARENQSAQKSTHSWKEIRYSNNINANIISSRVWNRVADFISYCVCASLVCVYMYFYWFASVYRCAWNEKIVYFGADGEFSLSTSFEYTSLYLSFSIFKIRYNLFFSFFFFFLVAIQRLVYSSKNHRREDMPALRISSII